MTSNSTENINYDTISRLTLIEIVSNQRDFPITLIQRILDFGKNDSAYKWNVFTKCISGIDK